MHLNRKLVFLWKLLSLLTCSLACLRQRNSHWRVQSFVGHPQTLKNGSGLGSAFPGKFDENNVSITPTTLTSTQNPVESDPSRDIICKPMDRQPELANKGLPLPMPLEANIPASVRGDGVQAHPLQGPVADTQSTQSPMTSETPNQQEELIIEGGTISISSVYSQGWVIIEICCVYSFKKAMMLLEI
jgi:hypothetical protein